ncbi:MAG: glutamine--fructose-6-phosphate transaminase (isomerizing) [Alphaproteobacteria bacterium]
MCGIIAINSNSAAANRIVEGLQILEYRGYDSAGVATWMDGKIDRRRAKGKLVNLREELTKSPLSGNIGIGHTRWATHGVPSLHNTHPHGNDRIALVHNGIIENHEEIKAELAAKGAEFESETDTEVLVRLIEDYIDQGHQAHEATFAALDRVEGSFAIAVIFADNPDTIIGARQGSPLVLGYGDGEMFLGSDSLALSHWTRRICYLDDGDRVIVTRDNARIYDAKNQEVTRPIKQLSPNEFMVSKGEYNHFMSKEIHEQPDCIQRVLSTYLSENHDALNVPELPFDLASVSRITIIACGTAYYAGAVAKYWFEQVARIPVEVDIASEFRYREGPMPENGLSIFISQSGETADTLAAFEYAKSQQQHTLGVVNVEESTLAREVDAALFTMAGPEVGVASTKAFTTQLTVLACLALQAAVKRGAVSEAQLQEYCHDLTTLPEFVRQAINREQALQDVSHDLAAARDVLYLGRGMSYPIALEGSLKLKEISYIHAEGYAAGEMKHGPIALIDEHVPVVVVAPTDDYFSKTASNIQEVIARRGKVIMISDNETLAGEDMKTVAMPHVPDFISPIVYAIPMQLLAYHTAAIKGTDIDQPRNLAKSVTVE